MVVSEETGTISVAYRGRLTLALQMNGDAADTSMVTATAMQLHARCTVIVDEAAGAQLKEKEYYRWIFDNEPEWEGYR